MDKATRSAIERATQQGRKLLDEDFSSQLEGTFDVMRSGVIASKAGAHLAPLQQSQWDKIVAAIEHKRAAEMTAQEAVKDYVRDAAFTTLNRFVALKMLEARQLVQECITKGEQSAGYREFCGMAPGIALLPDVAGYRLYLESLFDEFSTEIKVLFDRRDAASVLWPKRQTFEALLTILNSPELLGVWSEDETIGWVYQFFNSGEERKKMREESQAPRNSRELAVRNQFFTPRYVVQFLTDNTLGRLWLDIHGTSTRLSSICEYLVRPVDEATLTRPRKDPRNLRILDPACGSGHFLLYSFDLLLAIYEEAWSVEEDAPRSEATGRTLRDDYPNLIDLRHAAPMLIIEQNLYGVDIDPRCAQIAALALWLRAQRAWKDLGVSASERPRIHRTHIVVAEPMPGDAKLVEEFAGRLDPPLLGDLFKKMIDESLPAGELGMLLQVEERIASDLHTAREQFVKQRQTTGFLPGIAPMIRQGALDLSGIDDDRFFHEAEARIIEALRAFAETATGGVNARRRLFAGDAAQGIALIDLLRTRFDVVLMNPPFGDGVPAVAGRLKADYGAAANDLFSAFVKRGLQLRADGGLLGAITSRTGFFAQSLREWRREIYNSGLYLLADLGQGVMDAATVEAAAYCIGYAGPSFVFRHLIEDDKARGLSAAIRDLSDGKPQPNTYEPAREAIEALPDAPFAYWVSAAIAQKLAAGPRFEPHQGAVRKGLRTGDNPRFVRAYWEIAPERICTNGIHADTADGWVPLVMTGASQPWFAPIYLMINWSRGGRELRAYVLKYGTESRLIQAKDHYFKAGFSWTLRAVRLFPYAIPPGCIFTGSRPMAFAKNSKDAPATVALFASRVSSAFLRLYAEWFSRPKFLEGKLKLLPMPAETPDLFMALTEAFHEGSRNARREYQYYEPFLEFVAPRLELDSSEIAGLSFDRANLLPEHVEAMVRESYGLSESEGRTLELDLDEALAFASSNDGDPAEGGEPEEEDDAVVLVDGPAERAKRMISYAFGCLVGRWDIRIGLGLTLAPTRNEDEALRTTPQGFLQTEPDPPGVQNPYPIELWKDGIAVHDDGHARDLTAAILRVLAALGVERTTLLAELQDSDGDLGIEMRDRFFRWHLRVYSLGRRKAPIYWQLATPSARYSVWLYLHAFTNDTLYKVQNDYVAPKLAHEERRLESLRREVGESPKAAERKMLAAQQTFVEELRVLLDEVKRVAPLWNPNLNDGVIINFAALWRLVPHHKSWQKELKATWKALCAGDNDWAHIAMHLWPERVVPKCWTDRSLAIAHGLEDVFWAEEANGKWKTRLTPSRTVDELILERSSPAVKSALKVLLESPDSAPTSRRRRTATETGALS